MHYHIIIIYSWQPVHALEYCKYIVVLMMQLFQLTNFIYGLISYTKILKVHYSNLCSKWFSIILKGVTIIMHWVQVEPVCESLWIKASFKWCNFIKSDSEVILLTWFIDIGRTVATSWNFSTSITCRELKPSNHVCGGSGNLFSWSRPLQVSMVTCNTIMLILWKTRKSKVSCIVIDNLS